MDSIKSTKGASMGQSLKVNKRPTAVSAETKHSDVEPRQKYGRTRLNREVGGLPPDSTRNMREHVPGTLSPRDSERPFQSLANQFMEHGFIPQGTSPNMLRRFRVPMVEPNGNTTWICANSLAGYMNMTDSHGQRITCKDGSRKCKHPHPTLCRAHLNGECTRSRCKYAHLRLWTPPVRQPTPLTSSVEQFPQLSHDDTTTSSSSTDVEPCLLYTSDAADEV